MKITEPSTNPIPHPDELSQQHLVDKTVEPRDMQTEPIAEDLGRKTATGSGKERLHTQTQSNSITSEHPSPKTDITAGLDISSLSSWKPFTMRDAYAERPPLEYIVGNMFEIPSVNIVYGAPGSFKSFLLADLAGCVVGGVDWLPPLLNPSDTGMPTIQRPAVWLDFDNGQRRTLDRFQAIGNALGLPLDAPLFLYPMPNPILDAGDRTHVYELSEIINSCNAKLVVIDNLGAISGRADENSADMASIFVHLRWLAETTGAAILIIHHRRKANSSERKGDLLRGHSSIEASIDLALLLEKKQHSVNVQPTKTRGSDVAPFLAQFQCENDESNELMKARFYSKSNANDEKSRLIMEAIWEYLGDGKDKKGDITINVQENLRIQNTGIGINKIAETIDDMYELGYLNMEKGRNNAKFYSHSPDHHFE